MELNKTITMVEYTDYFLNTVKFLDIAETTKTAYRTFFNHIKYFFQRKKITDITKLDIQLYYKYLSEREYRPGKYVSSNTIRKHHDFLTQVFLSAIEDEIITENVMNKIKKPKKKEFHCEVYQEHEAFKLLHAVNFTDLKLPVILSLFYGLRRGEICGLKWKHINFEKEYILITDTRTTAGGKTIIKNTKSGKSCKMYLSGFLKEELDQEKKRQQEIFKTKNLDERYICVYKNTLKKEKRNTPITPTYITNSFPKLLEKNNLKKIRFHDLRHSCASIANANGETLVNISRLLRHSSTGITSKLYIHLFDELNRDTLATIEKSILSQK